MATRSFNLSNSNAKLEMRECTSAPSVLSLWVCVLLNLSEQVIVDLVEVVDHTLQFFVLRFHPFFVLLLILHNIGLHVVQLAQHLDKRDQMQTNGESFASDECKAKASAKFTATFTYLLKLLLATLEGHLKRVVFGLLLFQCLSMQCTRL